MNCAQHPDTAAVGYCRSCGKALCEACKREVQGTYYCESCLGARIHPGAAGGFGAGAGYEQPRGPEDASPGLALFLGFIPGVGAFYNGQFLKGFVHVIVMSTLIWMSDHGMGAFAGLLIAAWVFYMVFDAWTTAKARRDGLPIPDPIGLNAILEGREGTFRERVEQAGERIGTHVEYAAQNIGQHWQKAGGATPPGRRRRCGRCRDRCKPRCECFEHKSGDAHAGTGVNPRRGAGMVRRPWAGTTTGAEGAYYGARRGHSPVGAVVLIGLGVLFLLANLGWFSFHWISQFWPVILIVIGVWLFVQRQRDAR